MQILQDCRYALRLIRKNARFSGLMIFVLALGIGADTAVFRVVHETILKPLPFRDSSRLLAVWDTYLPQFAKVGVSPAELQAWQAQTDLFAESAWYRYVPQDGGLAFSGSDPMAVHAGFVSTNLFPMLGIAPAAGRAFGASEDPQSMLLSDRLWRRQFHGDREIIGKTVQFNGGAFTVVGVMPADGQFPDWADLWLPPGPLMGDELTNPVRHAMGFVARLQAGAGEEQARARLAGIARRLASEHRTTSTGWGIRVSGLQDDLTGKVRPVLWMLLGAASLLMLIACANVASLLLARASGRAKEMAIRTAVGANAARLAQQLVTESLVLALAGGVGGWLVAKLSLLVAMPERASLDASVMLFLWATTIVTGVLFGLAPAMQAVRADPQAAIKSGAVTGSGMATRSVLVAVELALTLTLAIGAGVLARSFVRLMEVNPGFRPEGVVTARILAPPSRKPADLFQRMREKLMTLPEVQSIAETNALPLIADRAFTSRFNVPGSPLIYPDSLPGAQIRVVTPDYFATMGIEMRSGRVFTDRDLGQDGVIVNESMARRFWPGRDAVGMRFITGPFAAKPAWSTIVGVAADVKQFGLDAEPSLDIYYPFIGAQFLVVKSRGAAGTLTAVLERTLHGVDADLAVSDVRTMEQISAESTRTRRLTMTLLATFAGLALVLALAGIYGVMSWWVTQRTREVGIRMALGAQQREVVGLVLGHGMRLTAAGLALGIAASMALRWVLAGMVFEVSAGDPATYILVTSAMLAVAAAACYLPARRASGVDPMTALREE